MVTFGGVWRYGIAKHMFTSLENMRVRLFIMMPMNVCQENTFIRLCNKKAAAILNRIYELVCHFLRNGFESHSNYKFRLSDNVEAGRWKGYLRLNEKKVYD